MGTGRRVPRHVVDVLLVLVMFGLPALVLGSQLDGASRIVALVGVGVLLAAGLALWKLPQRQAKAGRQRGAKKSTFELENEARKALADALGGLLLVVGLAFTWLQLADSRTEQRQARELAQQGQITDRFTAAVDQLGNEKLQVQLGGIYALERIARDSPPDAGPVLEVLTAFVRHQAPSPFLPGATPSATGTRPIPRADVQAVLTVIGRGSWPNPAAAPPREDESSPKAESSADEECIGIDLSGTELHHVRFEGVAGHRVCLEDANLEGAVLRGAELTGADLEDANLRDADLQGAHLRGAILTDRADLERADLRGTDLRGAILTGGTDLEGTNLEGADLKGADLRGADLTQTLGLTQQQIASALTDATTQLPSGLQATPAAPQE